MTENNRTRLLSAEEADLRQAAALLKAGELVAIPTETVYGLAANALDGRPWQKSLRPRAAPWTTPSLSILPAWNSGKGW